MNSILSHHNPNDPNFDAHVLKVKNNAYCIGCSASKFFLHLVLPFLFWFTSKNALILNWIDFSILGLLFFSAGITIIEFYRGRPSKYLYINVIPSIFLISSIFYVAFSFTSIGLNLRLLLASIFALPQFAIYANKSWKQNEFTHSKAKFLIRILFITAFYFALVDFQSSPIISLIYILSIGYLFVIFRKFSEYRVGQDKLAILHQNKFTSYLSKKFEKHGIMDKQGIIKSNKAELVFILLIFGLVVIISGNEPTVCNNNSFDQFAATSTIPWLIASSRPNFCPECGDRVESNEQYCDQCGFKISSPEKQTQQQQNTNWNQNQQQQRYNSRSNQGAGYFGPGRRGRTNNMSNQMMIGIAVGVALLGVFFTNSLILGILVGGLAFGGLYLASQTDSCCVQYLIYDCCSDLICSIICSNSRRR